MSFYTAISGVSFRNGGVRVDAGQSEPIPSERLDEDPFPLPSRRTRFLSAICEAVRQWKHRRWLRARRASIQTPFD